MIRRADLELTFRRAGPMVAGAHPQPTPQQIQAQQAAEAQKRDLVRRQSRRPTDKDLPDALDDIVIGDGVKRYQALREAERRLDAVMMRKRLDIQDSVNRNFKRYRTLRIWVSNTVDNQPWQLTSMDPDAFDFGGESQATYRVKIEGRLLDDEEDAIMSDEALDWEKGMKDGNGEDAATASRPGSSSFSTKRTKLSHFFKSITVDFDRSRSLNPDAFAPVEWMKPDKRHSIGAPATTSAVEFDCLEFERKGDENLNVTINLVRDENPERFKLSAPLAEVLDTEEEDRAGVVMGIWEYVKALGLQEDDESRRIKCDAKLRAVSSLAVHEEFVYL